MRGTAMSSTESRGGLEIPVPIPTVQLRPSIAEIEQTFLAAVDEMVESVRTLKSVDADLMSLLHIEPRRIFNIGVGEPIYADVDAALDAARAQIREHVSIASRGPLRLVALYNEYTEVMGLDTTLFVREFVETGPDLEDYVSKVCWSTCFTLGKPFQRKAHHRLRAPVHPLQVREFDQAARAIESTSEDSEMFELVCVDTSRAKARLRSKALELRDALLEHIILEVCMAVPTPTLCGHNSAMRFCVGGAPTPA